MSEVQSYEFVALERALSAAQMAELRAISTRAEISASRFWNEYHWGDLKADPAKLVERYFDAHLYVAGWGTHRLILRIPQAIDLRDLATRGDEAAGFTLRFEALRKRRARGRAFLNRWKRANEANEGGEGARSLPPARTM